VNNSAPSQSGVLESDTFFENKVSQQEKNVKRNFDYFNAVKRGDTETAQKMVDEFTSAGSTLLLSSQLLFEDRPKQCTHQGLNKK